MGSKTMLRPSRQAAKMSSESFGDSSLVFDVAAHRTLSRSYREAV
jgi:hypothetical protein